MEKIYQTDISALTYPEWVTFVFDHEVPPDRYDIDGLWYSSDDVDFPVDSEFPIADPANLVTHFTQLCNNFSDVSERFSLPQIDQGIWFLLSQPICFGGYLVNKDIPLDARLDCIHSMYRVYADFVAKSEVECMENCFDMWWDLLASALVFPVLFRCSGDEVRNLKREDFDEDEYRVQDTMFDTLCAILKLEDVRCQQFALHGLGHLAHPEIPKLIQNYIDRNRADWNDEGIAWLERCRDGTVM